MYLYLCHFVASQAESCSEKIQKGWKHIYPLCFIYNPFVMFFSWSFLASFLFFTEKSISFSMFDTVTLLEWSFQNSPWPFRLIEETCAHREEEMLFLYEICAFKSTMSCSHFQRNKESVHSSEARDAAGVLKFCEASRSVLVHDWISQR